MLLVVRCVAVIISCNLSDTFMIADCFDFLLRLCSWIGFVEIGTPLWPLVVALGCILRVPWVVGGGGLFELKVDLCVGLNNNGCLIGVEKAVAMIDLLSLLTFEIFVLICVLSIAP